ncbi:MAG: hypothetical protein IPK50_13490 [Fibrobacterota bacterium]|nr:hypothetical protein [Fibrobacterota bacterium]QQS03320.1 MAG: hypothetical protein IPK50_13490 [Fibrobacterota bacterium]
MVNKKSDTTTFERGPLSPSAVNVDTTTIPWNTAITYGTLKDVRDGKSYRTVKIGSQTWMAEDLAFDTVGAHWDAMAEAWGYPWSMAMGIDSRYDSADWTSTDRRKGVCPAGWHLPSLSEWKTLIAFAGGDSTAGSALKSTAGWYDNGNGLDNLGFRVLSSSKHYGGNDTLLGTSTLYWASTATSSTTSSWIASFYSWRPAVETGYGSRESGFHVRCIQD